MATETSKADHYNSQLFLKNVLRSHFNTNSPLLSTLNALQILLVLVLCTSTLAAFSQSIVKTLPGYAGDLPFKLETGYVSVGEWNDVHLFYYFIESEGNPREDPLLLWLTGGPGCSAFSGLVYEIGPLRLDTEHFDGKFPNFTLNPFSWTKVSSIIFLDAPVGTGFSYADNAESYVVDDLLSATDNYNFLLKGYIIGNPVTSQHYDKNARIEFAHRLALLSDKLYESIKHNCHGEYVTIDPNNAPCIKDLTLVTKCLANLNLAQILEPNCAFASRNSRPLHFEKDYFDGKFPNLAYNPFSWTKAASMIYLDGPVGSGFSYADNAEGYIGDDLLYATDIYNFLLKFYNYYVLSDIWANDERVREALQVRKGTKDKWLRCNETMAYTEVVYSSLDYHRNLSHTPLRALIYSGDHDMLVPYSGTHKWIESLGLTVDEEWRPWYSMRYIRDTVGFRLRFATVKARKKLNLTN
ncbi:hypothetical protein RHGRI_032529 [Rhododendron griersonianum]|uniref:Uncharacterized protein n=1 Tax=Rhododendron griersonianum TaxID=479676 RepID=A0AAV6ICQ1_9ERIC|nr:hypothetical protein RHGRI_032529 [Rhododendron griersonianum]